VLVGKGFVPLGVGGLSWPTVGSAVTRLAPRQAAK
jgi:hypothetical protein